MEKDLTFNQKFAVQVRVRELEEQIIKTIRRVIEMEAALFVIGFAIGAVVTLFFFFKLLIYEDHPMEVLGLVFGLFMIVLALSVCK